MNRIWKCRNRKGNIYNSWLASNIRHVIWVGSSIAQRLKVALDKHEAQTYVSILSFSSVQLLSRVRLFVTPWTAAHQTSLSITNSGAHSNSCAWSWWCHPIISFSVIPFSCLQHQGLQPVPSIRIFSQSQLCASRGQSIGVSTLASVFPMNTQDWSHLGLTGLISLQSKGLLRVFFNTTVHSTNSSVLSLFYCPTLRAIHDYWKNHKFD